MTSAGLGINGALWTLTIEVCFYVTLPYIARFFVGPNAWRAVLTMALLVVLAFQAWLIVRLDVWQSGLLYVWFIIVASVCAGLLFFASFPNAFAERILGAPPVRLLGIISYSVYLWHFPVIYFAKNYWVPAGMEGINKFYYLLVVCVSLTLLIGYFSYRYIELPFLSIARERHGKK